MKISRKTCTNHLGYTCETFLTFQQRALTKHPLPCNQLINHFYPGKIFFYSGIQVYLIPPTGKFQYTPIPHKSPGHFVPGENFFYELDIARAFCHLCRLGLFVFFRITPPHQPSRAQILSIHYNTPHNICQVPYTLRPTHIITVLHCLFHKLAILYPQVFHSFLIVFHRQIAQVFV